MNNITTKVVNLQLNAMNSKMYDIGILDRSNNRMINLYNKNIEYINTKIPLLKYKNINNHDIFVRPSKILNKAIILVDDINLDTVNTMVTDGVNPACIINTSPNNYQAWISLGDDLMFPKLKKLISQNFVKLYDADPASTDANHYGRLAGFTNRKPKYLTDKGYPWVKIISYEGKHAQATINIINKFIHSSEIMPNQNKDDNVSVTNSLINPDYKFTSASSIFSKSWKDWHDYTRNDDFSRGDFAVSCKMLKLGYSVDDIVMAILSDSPELSKRKTNHEFDYATRTVFAAKKILNSGK
jgi:hypothetical protein